MGGLLPQPLLEDMKAKKRRVLHHQQQLVERGLNLGPAGAAASDDEEYMLPPVSRGKRFPPPLHARSDHLLNFFCVLLVKKIIDLPGQQINDPSSGKRCSLLFLPANPLSPSRTLERLFELTRRPPRALNLPRALLPELQRCKDAVRCVELGSEVPGHRQEQLTQTLIVRL